MSRAQTVLYLFLIASITASSVRSEELSNVTQLAPVTTLLHGPASDTNLGVQQASFPWETASSSSVAVRDSTCECDYVNHGVYATFEYLNWRPRQRGMDFAVSEDGSALTIGSGQVHNIELDRDSGGRVSLGYRTRTDWTISAGYTYFDTMGTATALRPPNVGELFATRSHPDTNEETDSAIANGSFDYQVFDIFAGRSVYSNRFSNIQVFGGVRFADISQVLRVDYDGRDFVNGVVESDMDMDAFGFRLGVDGQWQAAGGFGLFGRMAGSLLHGRFNTSLFESNVNGSQIFTDVRDDYEQAVPVLDMAGGVSWQRNGFQVAVGYELTNWFDLSNRAMFIDDIHEGLYGPFETDVLLEGLFLSLGYSR